MRTIILLIGVIFLSGCSLFPRAPGEVKYIEIPEGYLQHCELPDIPNDNAELSDAFAKAYKCGEQGNKDKDRIKALPRN